MDLRLVPGALLLWAGCGAGLLGRRLPLVALAGAVLAVAVATVLPPRIRAGLLAGAALLVVGTGLAWLDVHRAQTDPAMIAAVRGAYATWTSH